jgi:hypothetical protein
MNLPYDIARCHGHPIQQCQDCQRRTETLRHPYRQSQMTVVFEDAAKCEYKIKEVK